MQTGSTRSTPGSYFMGKLVGTAAWSRADWASCRRYGLVFGFVVNLLNANVEWII
jgi:hypothetical protein